MPPSSDCDTVLRAVNLFEHAKQSCPMLSPFRCLPPCLWGRVAKSTSCILAPNSCVCLALFLAVSAPATLIQPGHVGWLSSMDVTWTDYPTDRVVCLSKEIATHSNSIQPVCELFSYGGTLLLSIRDHPRAASKAPMNIGELRAVLFRWKGRRYVRRWFTTFDVINVTPKAVSIHKLTFNPETALLLSSFSDEAVAGQWRSGSSAINDWISAGPTLKQWGSQQNSSWTSMLEACRFCNSKSVQRVLGVATSIAVNQSGVYVYALISPLWGKCYVGACGFRNERCPLQRWSEHIRQALLWMSKTSRKRHNSRRSPLYAAMAAVKPCNVIQVVLAAPSRNDLATAERYFIRKLQPVFNIREVDETVVSFSRSLSALVCDDVITFGNRILRQAKPRLSPLQWASLIADVATAGDRVLASKLARQARTTCSKARHLRALPQIIVPCAVPQQIISQIQKSFRNLLCSTPGFARLPQFTIQLTVGRVCWSKTPFAESLLAPSIPKIHTPVTCICHA